MLAVAAHTPERKASSQPQKQNRLNHNNQTRPCHTNRQPTAGSNSNSDPPSSASCDGQQRGPPAFCQQRRQSAQQQRKQHQRREESRACGRASGALHGKQEQQPREQVRQNTDKQEHAQDARTYAFEEDKNTPVWKKVDSGAIFGFVFDPFVFVFAVAASDFGSR